MGAQNFNFVPKYFHIGGFSAPNFTFWTKIFPQEENFLTISRQPKI